MCSMRIGRHIVKLRRRGYSFFIWKLGVRCWQDLELVLSMQLNDDRIQLYLDESHQLQRQCLNEVKLFAF